MISYRTMLRAGTALTVAGTVMLLALPIGRHWWTLAGSVMAFTGLGVIARARAGESAPPDC